jgi:hypothetical protein
LHTSLLAVSQTAAACPAKLAADIVGALLDAYDAGELFAPFYL